MAAVITVFAVSFIWVIAACWRAAHTPLTADEERDARQAVRARLDALAAEDQGPDWADQCALILSEPAHQQGADRLLDAIREGES